jgi:hypothetical protein
MTKSPTGIIPQRFNTPAQKRDVIAFLQSMPSPEHDKKELLFAWARNVGLRLSRADYEALHVLGGV